MHDALLWGLQHPQRRVLGRTPPLVGAATRLLFDKQMPRRPVPFGSGGAQALCYRPNIPLTAFRATMIFPLLPLGDLPRGVEERAPELSAIAAAAAVSSPDRGPGGPRTAARAKRARASTKPTMAAGRLLQRAVVKSEGPQRPGPDEVLPAFFVVSGRNGWKRGSRAAGRPRRYRGRRQHHRRLWVRVRDVADPGVP